MIAGYPNKSAQFITQLPVALALVALIAGGVFLLSRSDAQARDTIRKHHLADVEQALYLARDQHGAFPPYNEPTWCGRLNDPANAAVKADVEAALRQRIEKYGNLEKPFPTDPKAAQGQDYFYWKRSPAVFELYAILEADPNGNRRTDLCPAASGYTYDYGLNSALRESKEDL